MLVSPKLFRHFAVITVVITSGLAMFANGENREALAETIKAQQAKNSARHAEQGKPGTSRSIGKSKQAQAAAQNNVPVDDGGPPPVSAGGGGSSDMDSAWSGGASGFGGPGETATGDDAMGPIGPAGSGPQGVTGRPGGPKTNKPPRRPSQQQVEAMLAASRARASDGRVASDEESDEEE